MTPGALNIKGGSKEPLSISFDDNIGVTIKSHKKLSLNADDEIIIKTPQSISLKAQSQISVAKTGTKSGFSMETDINFLSNNVIKNGSDRETYSLFEDEPKEGKKPEPEKPPEEKKKGFNWGALLVAVVVAVAVVVSVATFGVGAGIACAVAAACIGGLCAAAGAAAISSNSSSGGQNDIGSCIMNAFKGVLSGASVFWNSSSRANSEKEIEGIVDETSNYSDNMLAYQRDIENMKNSTNILDGAKHFLTYLWDRWPGLWGEINEQNALNMGMEPEWAEMAGDYSSGIFLENFVAISINGVMAYKNLKTGEIISNGDFVAGSGMGNTAKGAGKSGEILGENATRFDSKTTWQNGKTERIDVENPLPGERPGQIHYHEQNNTKWYFDIEEKQFYNQKTGELAPKKIQKLLKNKDIINSINKALKFLGGNKLK